MPAFEVQLKTHIDNPIDRLTEKFPSLRIWTWCNFIQDVHELESDDPAELRSALDEFRGIYKILDEAEVSTNARMMTQNCICTKETTRAQGVMSTAGSSPSATRPYRSYSIG